MSLLKPTDVEALQIMREWVNQYKEDNETHPSLRVAQGAAIQAMEVMLVSWRHGLDRLAVKAGLEETKRMLEILHAFQGRLALLECQMEPTHGSTRSDDQGQS